MNCPSWQDQLALHAGGDLAPAEATLVARHLETCAACAQFAQDLCAGRELLLAAPDRQPDYDAMRAVIRAAIVRKRILRFSAVAVLAAAAFLGAILLHGHRPAARPIAAAVHPQPAPIIAAVEPATPAPVHRAKFRRRPVPAPSDQPRVAIYLATRNPTVAILLLQPKREISNE